MWHFSECGISHTLLGNLSPTEQSQEALTKNAGRSEGSSHLLFCPQFYWLSPGTLTWSRAVLLSVTYLGFCKSWNVLLPRFMKIFRLLWRLSLPFSLRRSGYNFFPWLLLEFLCLYLLLFPVEIILWDRVPPAGIRAPPLSCHRNTCDRWACLLSHLFVIISLLINLPLLPDCKSLET